VNPGKNDEGAPSIGDERPKTPAETFLRLRDSAVHREPGVTLALARRRCLVTATTATKLLRRTLLTDFCNRRETRAHPPVMRFPARSRGYPRERCL
jgi:hypothetical protein